MGSFEYRELRAIEAEQAAYDASMDGMLGILRAQAAAATVPPVEHSSVSRFGWPRELQTNEVKRFFMDYFDDDSEKACGICDGTVFFEDCRIDDRGREQSITRCSNCGSDE